MMVSEKWSNFSGVIVTNFILLIVAWPRALYPNALFVFLLFCLKLLQRGNVSGELTKKSIDLSCLKSAQRSDGLQ
jgi:hypothetical protein